MARPSLFIPAGSLVDVTTQTWSGTLLLRPDPDVDRRILDVLAGAMNAYPVALHALIVMPNQWHAMITAPHTAQLSRFVGYVSANVAKAVRAVHGGVGSVFRPRRPMVPILDGRAAEDRLHALLARGVADGLVASPLDWPGVSTARALADGDATLAPGVPLTPLPGWELLPPLERRARIRAHIAAIEAMGRARHPRPPGEAGVRALDPHERWPRDKSRPPHVHASDAVVRDQFLAARTAQRAAHRERARGATLDRLRSRPWTSTYN
jgi:hypothetical protein